MTLRIATGLLLTATLACDTTSGGSLTPEPTSVTEFHISVFNACTDDVTLHVGTSQTEGRKVLLFKLSRDSFKGTNEAVWLLDETEAPESDALYRDPLQPATDAPGRIPPALLAFANDAVARLVGDASSLACALGEVLSEPKPRVSFDPNETAAMGGGIVLDRRSRMLYDDARIYLNGESYLASGRDAKLMRSLADRRALGATETKRLSPEAHRLIEEWARAGWLHGAADEGD